MPFMQRAMAREGGNTSSPPATPLSAKKRKLGPGQAEKTVKVVPVLGQAAMDAAIAEEERKRRIAADQRAKDLGDSRWVLHAPINVTGKDMRKPLNIEYNGFSQIDNSSDSSDSNDAGEPVSRLKFNLKRIARVCVSGSVVTTFCPGLRSKKQVKSDIAHQDQGEGQSSTDYDLSEGSDDGSSQISDCRHHKEDRRQEPTSCAGRQVVPSKRRAEQVKPAPFAEKRRRRELNPNRSVTISAGTSGSGPSPSAVSNMACFACGKKGHMKATCPHVRRDGRLQQK